jgi:Skp family chaperone for outer membrane proteins
MKTIKLVLFLLFMLVSSAIYAQNFELILLGGMNASQVNGDKLAGFD